MMFHVKPQDSYSNAAEPLSSPSIRRLLAAHNIEATEAQSKALAKHARMVLEANREFNLTRISDPLDVLTLHILDSALAVSAVTATPAGPVADLGSGPGYPGIVAAILTGRPTVLVESVRKKARFLTSVAKEIGYDVAVYADRAEELARERNESFACVIARALAPLPSLVELAAPLLIEDGRLVAMKARLTEDELKSGLEAARICGMRQVELLTSEFAAAHLRTLVIYERSGPSRIRLPRRIGLAQRAPLA
jgi:16S rRNA (guanine527-N7)-methyltransferase